MARVIDAKIKIKGASGAGVEPTIAPSNNHLDGTWNATDIYSRELFLNEADGKAFVRLDSTIYEFAMVGGVGIISGLTDNYIPVASSDSTLEDSILYSDGNFIGLNTQTQSSASEMLRVETPDDSYGFSHTTPYTGIDTHDANVILASYLDGAGVAYFGTRTSDKLVLMTSDTSWANLDTSGNFYPETFNQDLGKDSANWRDLWLNRDLYFIGLTADTVPYLDADKILVSSTITPTELGYLTGASSSLQAQIDALVTGLSWKQAVRAATTANITLSGTQTVDGVALSVGDRVLVKDQSTATQNGLYTCRSTGWARTLDGDTGAELISATVAISEGTVNQDKQYVCTNDSITIGSTNITWVAVGGTTYVGTTNRITVTGNTIDISSSYVGQNTITTLGTITTGTWNGNAIAPAYGGTGVANGSNNTITFSGNYTLGLTLSGNTAITLPTTGTLATLAGSETLTNKTLTSPIINVTSDATGDIYYRNSGGSFTRLGIGATGDTLSVSSGLPAWTARVKYALTGGILSLSFSPASGSTQYIGGIDSGTPLTNAGARRIYIPQAGTIKSCYGYFTYANTPSTENQTINIRVNNTSNTAVTTTLSLTGSPAAYSNNGLSISVNQGDYIELQWVLPSMTTPPTGVRAHFVVYIEN